MAGVVEKIITHNYSSASSVLLFFFVAIMVLLS